MPGIIIVGAQWGDEGKGKIIDLLSSDADWIVRSQGGNNAGHTIVIGQDEYKLHLIPTGILHPHTMCTISAGCVIDPEVLITEIEILKEKSISCKERLMISPSAHVIMPYHKLIDHLYEHRKGAFPIGTTKRGIGPCYSDKAHRSGIRMGDFVCPNKLHSFLEETLPVKNEVLVKIFDVDPLSFTAVYQKYNELASILKPYVKTFNPELFDALTGKQTVLFEGAQGTFLDVTSGTYPYVTSSPTTSCGILSGAEMGPKYVDHILGVMKAYTTRVGNGPFPTEMDGEVSINLEQAREVGTTTGRDRRIGWFDAVLAKASARINGFSSLAVTKMDILDQFDEIKICTHYKISGTTVQFPPSETALWDEIEPIYETHPGWKTTLSECRSYHDLPNNAKSYLKRIEELSETPISILSLGPKREQTIVLNSPLPKTNKVLYDN